MSAIWCVISTSDRKQQIVKKIKMNKKNSNCKQGVMPNAKKNKDL